MGEKARKAAAREREQTWLILMANALHYQKAAAHYAEQAMRLSSQVIGADKGDVIGSFVFARHAQERAAGCAEAAQDYLTQLLEFDR